MTEDQAREAQVSEAQVSEAQIAVHWREDEYYVWIVPDMPKTRSGKIIRRVIAGVSNFTDVGDITTLANPEIVDQIREPAQSAKRARGEGPAQLSAAEAEEIGKFGSVQ